MCIKISLIRGMALLRSWTKNITCVILMLLFLMSKDPVLSTVSVREAFTGRIQCSLQTWVCSGKARCVQAVRRPFQHKKGLWFQLSCHQVLPFVKFSRSCLFSCSNITETEYVQDVPWLYTSHTSVLDQELPSQFPWRRAFGHWRLMPKKFSLWM